MQFVEKSALGLRVAVYRMSKDGDDPDFMIFPMIHVGSEDFYREVAERLEACDLILAEGVRSQKARVFIRFHRWIAGSKRLDLVPQHQMDLSRVRHKIVRVDMARAKFDRRWARLPIWLRIAIWIFLPFVALYIRLRGSRMELAQSLQMDDLKSPDEILSEGEELEELYDLILHARDRHIIRHIKGLSNEDYGRNSVIGLLYGAKHMRAIVRYLMDRRGYRVAEADWLTVFEH